MYFTALISICLPQSIREPCSHLRTKMRPFGNTFEQSLRRSRYQGKLPPTPNSIHNRWSELRLLKGIFAPGRYSSSTVPMFLHTRSGRTGNMAMHGFQLLGQTILLVRGYYLPALQLEQTIASTSSLHRSPHVRTQFLISERICSNS